MSGRAPAAAAAAALCLLLSPARRADAQQTQGRARPRVVLRADLIAARTTAAQGGAGLTFPLGNYVRVDAVGGVGVGWRDGGSRASVRGDLVGRFVLDPFRESRWSPYGGAGVSALRMGSEDWRGYLLAVLGVEGPAARGLLPALELGLGGGARVGLVLRGAAPNRR